MKRMEPRAAYAAERAAALAGVPVRTVYYWASRDIWSPSVSSAKVRLWSLADVVALRAIYWLRSQLKEAATDSKPWPIPRTTMREVRRTIGEIRFEGMDLTRAALHVDLGGHVLLRRNHGLSRPGGQTVAEPVVIDILRPFELAKNVAGPDLVNPRPKLRIIPGKLGGEPHVEGTRVRSVDIDALLQRGYAARDVIDLFPFLEAEAIRQASELEAQLRRNLASRAA